MGARETRGMTSGPVCAIGGRELTVRDGSYPNQRAVCCGPEYVAAVNASNPAEAEARARRLAACWNACKGVDALVLEPADGYDGASLARLLDAAGPVVTFVVWLDAMVENGDYGPVTADTGICTIQGGGGGMTLTYGMLDRLRYAVNGLCAGPGPPAAAGESENGEAHAGDGTTEIDESIGF